MLYFDFSTVPVVESAEPEPTAQPESADRPPVAAVEETPTPTLTPPPPEQPAAENNKGTVNNCCTYTHCSSLLFGLSQHIDSQARTASEFLFLLTGMMFVIQTFGKLRLSTSTESRASQTNSETRLKNHSTFIPRHGQVDIGSLRAV